MTELYNIKLKQKSFQIRFLDSYSKASMFDAYKSSSKRLLLLDYDGTLVSFTSNPDQALPGTELRELLYDLSGKPENDVYLISGRNSSWLDREFGDLPINLIAEHG
ncbi:MAG: trehalose-phosphatase, partial [Flavisolibacter sp.]